jgi:hypothetical protein
MLRHISDQIASFCYFDVGGGSSVCVCVCVCLYLCVFVCDSYFHFAVRCLVSCVFLGVVILCVLEFFF